MNDAELRTALDRHDSRARDGRGAEGKRRPSGHGDGARAARLPPLHRGDGHSPSHPDWQNRDRFVLSAGHACILQYATLHLTGYNLSLEELKRFRQWQSITPGHPEHFLTPGVETTTGPLGQGFANGVGMAIAERFLADAYNRPHHEIVDHRVYAICSDGDMMEGVSNEAASIAGSSGSASSSTSTTTTGSRSTARRRSRHGEDAASASRRRAGTSSASTRAKTSTRCGTRSGPRRPRSRGPR